MIEQTKVDNEETMSTKESLDLVKKEAKKDTRHHLKTIHYDLRQIRGGELNKKLLNNALDSIEVALKNKEVSGNSYNIVKLVRALNSILNSNKEELSKNNRFNSVFEQLKEAAKKSVEKSEKNITKENSTAEVALSTHYEIGSVFKDQLSDLEKKENIQKFQDLYEKTKDKLSELPKRFFELRIRQLECLYGDDQESEEFQTKVKKLVADFEELSKFEIGDNFDNYNFNNEKIVLSKLESLNIKRDFLNEELKKEDIEEARTFVDGVELKLLEWVKNDHRDVERYRKVAGLLNKANIVFKELRMEDRIEMQKQYDRHLAVIFGIEGDGRQHTLKSAIEEAKQEIQDIEEGKVGAASIESVYKEINDRIKEFHTIVRLVVDIFPEVISSNYKKLQDDYLLELIKIIPVDQLKGGEDRAEKGKKGKEVGIMAIQKKLTTESGRLFNQVLLALLQTKNEKIFPEFYANSIYKKQSGKIRYDQEERNTEILYKIFDKNKEKKISLMYKTRYLFLKVEKVNFIIRNIIKSRESERKMDKKRYKRLERMNLLQLNRVLADINKIRKDVYNSSTKVGKKFIGIFAETTNLLNSMTRKNDWKKTFIDAAKSADIGELQRLQTKVIRPLQDKSYVVPHILSIYLTKTDPVLEKFVKKNIEVKGQLKSSKNDPVFYRDGWRERNNEETVKMLYGDVVPVVKYDAKK